MRSEGTSDITRVVLSVVVIGVLIVGSLWTLLPFISGLTWATTITIATWPALLRLQQLTGRRSLAVAIMTLLVLLAFIAPLAVAINTLLGAAARGPAVISDFAAGGLGPPPAWLADIPWFGARLLARWQTLAAGGPEALVTALEPYAGAAAAAAIAATGGVGSAAVLGLLTVIMVGILYAQGDTAAQGTLAFAHRLSGETGERAVILAGQAIRGVALGVVVTALTQSVLAGIALWLFGIPHAGVLMAIAFVFSVAQIGPLPVLAAAVLWLYWTGSTGTAIGLAVVSLPVIMLDNVLRPWLIRRGVELPMLLIVAGVIGGLVGFGVVGLFIGPVLLAVTYTLLKEWIATGPSPSS